MMKIAIEIIQVAEALEYKLDKVPASAPHLEEIGSRMATRN